jgi:hypothetical protein
MAWSDRKYPIFKILVLQSGIVVPCNLSIQKAEAGGSQILVTPGYMLRPCQRQKRKEGKKEGKEEKREGGKEGGKTVDRFIVDSLIG